MHNNDYAVFLGLDVGKGEHHAVGLAPDGKRLHDAPLPNTEDRLTALYDKLSRHGRVLVVVDQPASIGALPVAVARVSGCEVAYLPGLAMRRLADLHPGTAKTDARDAYVIADAARTIGHNDLDRASRPILRHGGRCRNADSNTAGQGEEGCKRPHSPPRRCRLRHRS